MKRSFAEGSGFLSGCLTNNNYFKKKDFKKMYSNLMIQYQITVHKTLTKVKKNAENLCLLTINRTTYYIVQVLVEGMLSWKTIVICTIT